jgi:hypothetical protein
VPEGDSVYRLARRLERSLDGHTVVRSQLRVPAHATADLSGSTLLRHDTHGKHLLTRFDSGLTLHTHLRMDGSWTITRPGRRLPRRLMPDVLGEPLGQRALLPLGTQPVDTDRGRRGAGAGPTRRTCPQALGYRGARPSGDDGVDATWRAALRDGAGGTTLSAVPHDRAGGRPGPGDPGQRRTWWCPRCQPGPGPS